MKQIHSCKRLNGQIAMGNGFLFEGVSINELVAIGIKNIGMETTEHSATVFTMPSGAQRAILTLDNPEDPSDITKDLAFVSRVLYNGADTVLMKVGGWINIGSSAVRNTIRQLVSSLMTGLGKTTLVKAFDARLAGSANVYNTQCILVQRTGSDWDQTSKVTALVTDGGLALDYATIDPTYKGHGVRVSGAQGSLAHSIEFDAKGMEINRQRGSIEHVDRLGETAFGRIVEISRTRETEPGHYSGVATIANRNGSYATHLVKLLFGESGLLRVKDAQSILPDFSSKVPVLMYIGESNLLNSNGRTAAAFIRHRGAELATSAEIVLCDSAEGNEDVLLARNVNLQGRVIDMMLTRIK